MTRPVAQDLVYTNHLVTTPVTQDLVHRIVCHQGGLNPKSSVPSINAMNKHYTIMKSLISSLRLPKRDVQVTPVGQTFVHFCDEEKAAWSGPIAALFFEPHVESRGLQLVMTFANRDVSNCLCVFYFFSPTDGILLHCKTQASTFTTFLRWLQSHSLQIKPFN